MSIGKSMFSGPESIGALLTDDDRMFEKNRVLDPAPSQKLVNNIIENVRGTFPQLATCRDRQCLGRVRRLHAGCGAGHLGGRHGQRALSGRRLLGPRFWHRGRASVI